MTQKIKHMSIYEIESVDYQTATEWLEKSIAEKAIVNGYECFFVDFEGAFGYSMLVFKNGHHIKYANDYQLHHSGKTIEQLKDFYLNSIALKVFTDEQFFSPCKDYSEYKRKQDFATNHWVMQFGCVSAWYIGQPDDEQKEAMRTMVFDRYGMCYVENEDIVKKHNEMFDFLDKEIVRMIHDRETFRQMVRSELINHESCCTHDYTEALESLGLSFGFLQDWQKTIVLDEQYVQDMRTDI